MAAHTPGPMELVEKEDGYEFRLGTAILNRGHWEPQHVIVYEHGLVNNPDFADSGEIEQCNEAEANACRFVALWNACPEISLADLERIAALKDPAARLAALSAFAENAMRELR